MTNSGRLLPLICLSAVFLFPTLPGSVCRRGNDPLRSGQLQDPAQDPAQQPEHTNRLVDETSPYLLQHAHNPVDWYPWGEEAFAKARREDKPIFLSVGYSTCYWCHVMERESFEDAEVARILNEHFVAIKVDREERPEVDQQFMIATQLITGSGGWPNSVWLTPDGEPWMAATYIPRERFKAVLGQLNHIWRNQRDAVLEQAGKLADAIGDVGNATYQDQPISAELFQTNLQALLARFDEQRGGFGDEPKFPPHADLTWLIDQYRRSSDEQLLPLITKTLDEMTRGGIHDHIGDGFHRYATDGAWRLPHFEKMLYDNAQLMHLYTDGFLLAGHEEYRSTVAGIFAWLQREMTNESGAFYSAIDSESDGEEGGFYVWPYAELLQVLGEADGQLFADIFNAQPQGNYREESTGEPAPDNVLYLEQSLADYAVQRELDAEQLRQKIQQMKSRLLEVRGQREYPHLDDKVIAAWNGLMIRGLAYAGRHLDRPEYVAAAEAAAEFLLQEMMTDDGKLFRTWRNGQAKLPGYLTDYAFFASGLIELHRATGKQLYLDQARRLAEVLLTDFADPQQGGFYFTAEPTDGEEAFVIRAKTLDVGGNLPSGNGVATQVLLDLGELTGDPRFRDWARKSVTGFSGYLWSYPGQADRHLLIAASRLQAGEEAGNQTLAADSSFQETAIRGEVFLSKLTVASGDRLRIQLRLKIGDGWHLYGDNPEIDFLRGAKLEVAASDWIEQVTVTNPPGNKRMDPILEKEVATLHGTVEFTATIKVAPSAVAGPRKLNLTFLSQACDASKCLPPTESEIELSVTVGDKSDAVRFPSIFKD